MKYEFNVDYQKKVLKVLIEDKNLYLNEFLKEDLFDDPILRIIYKFIEYQVKKSLMIPSYDVIKSLCGGIFLNGNEYTETKKRVITTLDEIKEMEVEKSEILIVIENFVRAQRVRSLLFTMSKDFEEGKYDIDNYTKDIIAINSFQVNVKDEILFSRMREEPIIEKERIPTCFPTLTEWFGGGIEKGELGIILGQYDIGKSWMLVNLLGPCVTLAKDAVYLTFELAKENVRIRIEEFLKHKFPNKKLGSEIAIKEYAPGTITVNTIRAYINRLRTVEHINPQVIMIDAIKHIRPSFFTTDDWRNMSTVAEEVRALAKLEDVAVWTVAHVTREAIGRDYSGEDVGRSIELMNNTDLAVALTVTESADYLELKGSKWRRSKKQKNKKIKIKLDLDNGLMTEETKGIAVTDIKMLNKKV